MSTQTQSTQLNKIPNDFVITYYADKYMKFITRRGCWVKPSSDFEFPITGKAYLSSKGQICFIYWDKDAEPDEKGNQWRCAKNPFTIKVDSNELS